MARKKNAHQSVTLAQVINGEVLHDLAGARSFEKGEDYFDSGCVGRSDAYENRVTASVAGTRKYTVKLWVEKDVLHYDCTCPMGKEGAFCKHCVAVGLAVMEQHEEGGRQCGAHDDSPMTMEGLKAYLAGQSKENLVDLLMGQAFENDGLRRRLLMRAAAGRAGKGAGKVDVRPFINAIDHALEEQGYISSYYEDAGCVGCIDEAVDLIEDLLVDGHGAEAVEVIEHALGAVAEAVGYTDDSDDYLGDVLERLAELHFFACTKAKINSDVLAERLFDLELNDEYGVFQGAVERYAKLLGKKGLAKYRRLAEAVWAETPFQNPGEDLFGNYQWYAIAAIMEMLARMSGDFDEWIAVKSRDLSKPYCFLEIAEACKVARKYDMALDWAERGVKAFSNHPDPGLWEFLADEYHRRKRHGDAIMIIWAVFADLPTFKTYQLLASHAKRVKDWPNWRDRAIKKVTEHIAKQKKEESRTRFAWTAPVDQSLLVEIFLWEEEVDAAWKTAKAGGCSASLWLDLAKHRAKEHPEDAVQVYQERIEPTLAGKNDTAYAQAVEYLRIIRDLMNRLNRQAEFAAYLTAIRNTHKLKRNFIKRLDKFKG